MAFLLMKSEVKKYHLKTGDVVVMGIHELEYTDLRESAYSFEPLEENDGDDAVTEFPN